MIDFTPTTDRVRGVVAQISDDQLESPTPAGMTVNQVLQHLIGLSSAFIGAATKADDASTNTPPEPATGSIPADWRDQVDDGLAALAQAWQDDVAWTGMTRAGGVELPGEIGGLVALDEVLLHGWDLARATGQSYVPTEAEAQAVLPIVTPDAADPEGAGRAGLFGPVVAVSDDGPLFDRVLGLAGRDPGWEVSAE